MKNNILNSFVISCSVLFVCGCAVGPDYTKPELPEYNTWLEDQSDVLDTKEDSDTNSIDKWWTTFNDPVLDSLIQKAYQQNLSLQIAGIRILEARAQLGIAIGDIYPQSQSIGSALTGNDLSENSANTSSGLDLNYNDLSLGFDASWEADLWGKFRRAIESDVSSLESSVANYDDLLVTLTAEVANTYVQIRTFESLLLIAQENVKIQSESLRIAEVRYDAGEVTNLDVQQAKSLLRNTQASVPRLESSLRQANNALAILLGELPGNLKAILDTPSKAIPEVPEKIMVGVPAEFLRRRPDIRFAERQLAAQSALIGVAKADLYPHFSLFGSIGLVSSNASVTSAGSPGSSLSDLWDSDSVEFFGGPQIGWNVFNYGRIKNRVRVQDARFQQLAVNYQETVLKSAQEVEDAMVAFIRGQAEAKFLKESVDAAERAVEISMIQYKEGLIDFQRVIDSQRFQAQQQDTATQVYGAVATNLIATYKALGGGWQSRQGQDIVSVENRKQMQDRTDWGQLISDEELESFTAEKAGDQSLLPDL